MIKIPRKLLYASLGSFKFSTLSQDVWNNACLKQLNAFSVKSRLYAYFCISSVGVGTCIRSLINIIGKWSGKSVLTMALLKSLFMMQLVIMLSMAVAVCLVTLVGLFIVGIILNPNIKFTKLWTFLFVWKSRRLILKSPARKKVLLTVVLFERIFFEKGFTYVYIAIRLPVYHIKDNISSLPIQYFNIFTAYP